MPTVNYHSLNGRLSSTSTVSGGRSGSDILPDALGNVIRTANNTVAAGRTVRYAAYGNILSSTGGWDRPRNGWVGRYGYRRTDMKHADQFVRSRHFSNVNARWISVDLLWPKMSAYGYVGGQPTKFVDPTGLDPFLELQYSVRTTLSQQQWEALQYAADFAIVAYEAGAPETIALAWQAAAASVTATVSEAAAPAVLAALAGWFSGRYLDKTFNISNWILELAFPSSQGPSQEYIRSSQDRIRQVSHYDYGYLDPNTLTREQEYAKRLADRRKKKKQCKSERCSKSTLDRMQKEMHFICDTPTRCTQHDSCATIASSIAITDKCRRLRKKIMDKCFYGGDGIHKDRYNQVTAKMVNCYKAGAKPGDFREGCWEKREFPRKPDFPPRPPEAEE